MQFEELDKRVNEAASQHQPAFDTKAWEKMSQLLDEQLPQKKEKKRRIFLFLLFLLPLAAGSIFILSDQSSKKPVTTLQHINKPSSFENSPTPDLEGKEENNFSNTENEAKNFLKKIITVNSKSKGAYLVQVSTQSSIPNTSPQTTFLSNNSFNNKNEKNNNNIVSVTTNQASINTIPENNQELQNRKPVSETNRVPPISETDQNKPADLLIEKDITKNEKSVKKDSSATVSSAEKNRQSKHLNRWALTFSTGPDISEANSNGLGKTTITLGAGINYSISKKFTLRTGFYTSKKIYSAAAGSYHPPAGYWTYYYDLKKVDANCTVYEIPLTVSYNFAQAKKNTWFGSVGLSSYLMKKETYNYTYKDYAGQLQNKSWSIENKNKHYFSVLDLSAGYKYAISKKVLLMAEPYLRLPLSGVGFGKIKLNSGGIIFTVSVSAFGKH